MASQATSTAIDRYLRTGEYDVLFRDWPGGSIIECAKRGSVALQTALIEEIRRREQVAAADHASAIPETELVDFTRTKVGPMVRGLFSRKEAEPVLALLEKSVGFLTSRHVATQIRTEDLGTAWEIANIYLGSIGAERLDGSDRHFMGFSVNTTCYVSTQYFSTDDPFEDFVVHEAAHVFHNCRRRTAGLTESRRRQWLLPIEYAKRETFAYACEAYSRILEQATRLADRQALVEQLRQLPPPPEERVSPGEYFDVLTEAVSRRNGWKAILQRCSVRKGD